MRVWGGVEASQPWCWPTRASSGTDEPSQMLPYAILASLESEVKVNKPSEGTAAELAAVEQSHANSSVDVEG